MREKKDMKGRIKKIYDALPRLDDQRCGYRTCGEFARAVADGKAPCYGCVSGGAQVAARVCEIMGAKVPQEARAQFGPSPVFCQPRLSRGRGMGKGRGRGLGRGRSMDQAPGMGRVGRMGRGFGRGWHGG